MPNKEFLETYPLYKKFKFERLFPNQLDQIPQPKINVYCKNCKSIQTFVMTNRWYEGRAVNNHYTGLVLHAKYICASCENFTQNYLIKFGEDHDYIMKVGQYPPWEISVDKDLSKILDEYLNTYKKGLICESQGYGVGAYAYYRRIIEEIIDELLDSITELVDEENREKYENALQKTKKSHIAKDKIELVKDLLPSVLRPNGTNPLNLLHSQLSEGIHALPDEECLEKAGYIREILLFLVKEIVNHQNSSKAFTESMKKILDKKIT